MANLLKNEKILKAKDFYFEHELMINIIISSVLIFLSCFWFPLMYVLIAFLLVSYWTLDIGDMFSLTMFLMMFSKFILLFVISAVYTFIVLAIRYVIDVHKKQAKVLKWPLILTTVIACLSMCVVYDTDVYSIFQGLLIVALLYFVYLAIAYHEKIKTYRCFKCLLLGMIVASAMSFFFFFVPCCETLAYTEWKLEMVNLHDVIFQFDRGNYRLSLLSFHTNHLSVIMLISSAYAVNAFLARRGKKAKDLIFLALLLMFSIGIGSLTLSKTFIVGESFILLVGIIGGIVKYRLKSLRIIIPVVAILGILATIFHEKVFAVFDRFLTYGYRTIFDKITTGRGGIWQAYINKMLENPLILIFGAGLLTSEVIPIGPHSGYVFMFYRFGIIGTLLICTLVASYVFSLKKDYQFKFRKILPVLIFLMVSIIEACFDERWYFFVLAILFMIDERTIKEKSKIQNEAQKKENDENSISEQNLIDKI